MTKLEDIEKRNNVGGEIDVYELIEHKDWLINRVKKLEEALKSIEPITGYRNGKDTVKIDRDLVDNALKEDS